MRATARRGGRLAAWLVLAAAPLAVPVRAGTAPPPDRIVDVGGPGAPGRLALDEAPPNPRATILMLPGGSGDIGLGPDGSIRHGANFVVRTRRRWVAAGYAVLIPDAGPGANLRGRRSGRAEAADVLDLIRFAHTTHHVPVFLLGTSQGSIAAMNAAAHAPLGQVAGVVLTESVTRLGGRRETIFDADPGEVSIPALVVANADDRCPVAPPGDAPRIAAALSRSPGVRVIRVEGGTQRSDRPCGSLTPHGYSGIEQAVVSAIVDWMGAHL